jgi:chromosome segregation ATPase
MSLLKAKNPKLESSGYIDKPQIGKIVFKAVRDALNQEAVKVVEELEKQLTAIIGSLDSKDTGAAHYSTKCSNDDAYCKIKRDIKQLFIYLQRVLMLNVTQDLCKQLTREFDEWMKTIGRSKVERQQPEQKAVDYEKSIHDLSDKTPEYEIELGRCEEVQCDMNDGYENLNEHVKSLFESTHNVTDLLEYVSRKFLEVKEENRKLKGVA